VRFSRPMTPGGALTTRIHSPEPDSDFVRFDAVDDGGTVVLKDGLAELAGAGLAS
jgi:hypothetical protein